MGDREWRARADLWDPQEYGHVAVVVGSLKLLFYCNTKNQTTESWVSGNRESGESVGSLPTMSAKSCTISGIPQGPCCIRQ